MRDSHGARRVAVVRSAAVGPLDGTGSTPVVTKEERARRSAVLEWMSDPPAAQAAELRQTLASAGLYSDGDRRWTRSARPIRYGVGP